MKFDVIEESIQADVPNNWDHRTGAGGAATY
jgi:hypothetical protein